MINTGSAKLYPPIEPYDGGALDVGDGNLVAWEVSGAPDGKPAVVLHGGPGQGCAPNMRRAFDPRLYRIILFDQRGCGRSTPHASDPATQMRFNTTEHLIDDLEALRVHLGALIRNASRLAGIPGVLIHGRRDISCPVDTAWAIARAWPGAELVVIEDAGHLRSDAKRAALLRALDAFARR